MLLCECLESSILKSGGTISSVEPKICEEICVIRNEKDCCDDDVVARYVLETKQDNIKSDKSARPALFTVNNKCPKKLSVLLKDGDFPAVIDAARRHNRIRITGYVELSAREIKKFTDLNVIVDNYSYNAESGFDFQKHCSISSFSGADLKALKGEFKIHVYLSKISRKYVEL